jgi:hypothetical protein
MQGSLLGLVGLLTLAAVLLARRNWKGNRGDARGAGRIAGFVYAVLMAAWAVGADHSPNVPEELSLLVIALGGSGLVAALVWIIYMALEPFVRRRWPHMLIGWTRVLAGRIADPLVGRDLLVGALGGAALAALYHAALLAPGWIGRPPLSPAGSAPTVFLVVGQIGFGVYQALFTLFLLLMLRIVLRRDLLAAIALGIVIALMLGVQTGATGLSLGIGAVGAVVVLTVLFRAGLLALTVLGAVSNVLSIAPITLNPSVWYAPSAFAGLALVLVVAAWGFYQAIAGQPLFGNLIDD